MDDWEEYYKKPNKNFAGTPNQQKVYSTYYFGYLNDYSNGNNMSPGTYDECFTETTATTNLKKWIKVFKICCVVIFVILIIFGIISAYNSSFVVERENSWSSETYRRFDLAFFVGYLLGYGIAMFVYFLLYKLTSAVLNSIAQITRNTGISAKLAAFNTRNQMMKDASKEKEN